MMKQKPKKIFEDIRFLVSCAVASLGIRKISIEEKDGMHELRPSLHVFLRSPTGSGKSTILNYIAKLTGGLNVDGSTSPGLIGTFDKSTHQLVPGAAWEGRNNLLLFDEFSFRKKSDD